MSTIDEELEIIKNEKSIKKLKEMMMIFHPDYTPLEKTVYKRAIDDKIKYLEKYKKLP